jgi:hypothetical protein
VLGTAITRFVAGTRHVEIARTVLSTVRRGLPPQLRSAVRSR